MSRRKRTQHDAPLFDAVYAHAKRKVTSFHTPGHKNGNAIDPLLRKFVGKNLFAMDVTVFPEVDSLHDPTGPIRQAQRLYADLYGSKEVFFLVNGSSSGNQAMLIAACNPGDSVIVSRNAHKSVMSGIILSGVWPIWIQPELDKHFDVFFDSSPQQIDATLKKYPEAKAVFITHPTYHGIATDIKTIAQIVHDHGKLLLVDEAHGSHLKFSSQLPMSALDAGADLVVHSAHKTLAVMSQGSVLHYNTDAIDINRLRSVVSMLQTTSPNYLILATLDLARRQMYQKGEHLVAQMVRNGKYARKKIKTLKRITTFSRNDIRARGYDLDTTKLSINVTRTGLDGQKVEDILAKQYAVQVDCADIYNLIAIMGVGTQKKDIIALVHALADIEEKYHGPLRNDERDLPSLTTEMFLSPRDVFLSSEAKKVSIRKAAGHISAQTLTPYPPGIPILIPGERISQEICDYLSHLNAKAIRVSGQETKKLTSIKVVSVD